MRALPKKIDLLANEEKWQHKWEEWGIYNFDWSDRSRPTFCIDTPPPYPSGEFHMGNVLNWTYFDIVARYKRMNGFNVYFPQGWDCHGLPTEVEAEKEYKIRKSELDPQKFRELCENVTNKYITIMKTAIKRLGCSNDWTTEYKTMNPDYWRRTQLSFIMLNEKGYIYQGTYPVNWCPRCETAIADAEVEHATRQGRLNYIRFMLKNRSYLTIATTRPELLPACVTVAVNPNDTRYQKFVGHSITVPIANREVKIVADEMADPEFGTGVVMICTYGDKADVKFVQKHHLPVIMTITETGKLNEQAGKYVDLDIVEAKKAITQDLQTQGFLEKTEPVTQEVGMCWRCQTPIEILERKQWFMKTLQLTDEIVKKAEEVSWYPRYAKNRLIDWAKSLDWDWVISRQRIFATPIPVWYCSDCGESIMAREEWLPIDPKAASPKIRKCPKCGHYGDFIPETDVFDTWMDSSITCAVHAGWPDKPAKEWLRLFPADLHPSGVDIIRTWAYYLMARHLALFNKKPYESCLINGMVLGTDGRMMHKSLGNYVATNEVFQKYGADASRQWAAGGGTTGSDVPFRWPDVEYAWRFLIKLWNASRFASSMLEDYVPVKAPTLTPLDQWLLAKMDLATIKVTLALEKCQFNIAMEEIRNFAWRDLCDNYIEAAKHRLYKEEKYGKEKRTGAQYTLYTALYRLLQLFAPLAPHITEEIYQSMFFEDVKHRSIHLSQWPRVDEKSMDNESAQRGDLVVAVISQIRREKARKRMPLNSSIKRLVIHSGTKEYAEILSESSEDITGTCKIDDISISPSIGEGVPVDGYPKIKLVGI
ncbi:MAG: valine--tRNA ligase [Candidatus Bathyarchaeota archaeon]|nr:MAG: valine--tRNA ligase [Candidatus Bathyarchaeota archaeon]